jgi:outer membrane protein assembly factor BamE
LRLLLAFLLLALLAGCGTWPRLTSLLSPYRIEIQQGNYVTQEQVAQLYKGMPRDQVRYLLGTPLLADPFHADRWDYVFRRLRANSRELEERRLTLFFADDKLERVEGDVAVAVGTSPTGEPTLPTAPPTPPVPGAGPPPATPTADAATGAAPPLPPAAAADGRGLPTGDPPGGPAPQNLPPAAQPPIGQQ